MTESATWILGDVHAGTDADADRALLTLLTIAADRRTDLLLMGDLFTAWLGPPRFWPDHHRPLLEALRRVRNFGGRVRFVVGNRDYLVHDLIGDVFDAVYTDPVRLDIGTQPTWVLHGDGIVAGDWAYRRWRQFSRSTWATAVLRRLPAPVARRLPIWVERQLATTNRTYKTGELPLAALSAVAKAAHTAGASLCLMGHFHEPAQHVIDGVQIRIVPGWREYQVVLVVEGERLVERALPELESA